jgi:hypothetical protein
MDLDDAAQPFEVAQKLQLPALSSSRSFHITGCSALQGTGIMVSRESEESCGDGSKSLSNTDKGRTSSIWWLLKAAR